MPDVALYGSGLPAEENAAPIGSDGEGPGLAEMKRLRRLASVDGPKKQTRFLETGYRKGGDACRPASTPRQ
jgi:hypothetical protein